MKYVTIPIRYELQPFDDERFLKLKIYVMHDKLNLNNSFFDMNTIEEAKESIKNIPILAYIKKTEDEMKDFAGHEVVLTAVEKDGEKEYKFYYLERPIGVIPEINNYHYEEIEDKKYVVVDGYVWKTYANEALDIFERDGEKSVSMEIKIDNGYFDKDNNYYVITKYRYLGITVLGDDVAPAMVNARAEVYEKLQYYQMIEELSEILKSYMAGDVKMEEKKKEIEIDNSKESAIMEENWGDIDKSELRKEIMSAENYRELVKEAYLVIEDGWEEAPSEHLKYPHHVIRDGKLVVHKQGCQVAYAFLQKNDPNNEDAKAHLEKHYKELGLEFEEYQLTQQQIISEFNRLFEGILAQDGYPKYNYLDHDDENVYVYDFDDRQMYGFKYTVDGDNVAIDFNSKFKIKIMYVPVDNDEVIELDFIHKLEYERLYSEYIELQKFKKEKLLEEKMKKIDELFARKEFTVLDEVDISDLKYRAKDMEIEELEKELYVLLGKKLADKISYSEKKDGVIKMEIPPQPSDMNKQFKIYDSIIQKYVRRN